MTENHWKFTFAFLTVVSVCPLVGAWWLTKIAEHRSDLFFGASVVGLSFVGGYIFWLVRKLPIKAGAAVSLIDVGLLYYSWNHFIAVR